MRSIDLSVIGNNSTLTWMLMCPTTSNFEPPLTRFGTGHPALSRPRVENETREEKKSPTDVDSNFNCDRVRGLMNTRLTILFCVCVEETMR